MPPILGTAASASAIGRHLPGGGRLVANLSLSGNSADYLLDTSKVSGYVAGQTDVILTIESGAVIGSTSTSTYAVNVDTSWNAGDTVKIINNGTIEGKGGAGGAADSSGGAGGPALRCQRAVTVDNVGTIASGGAGGAGGTSSGNVAEGSWTGGKSGPECIVTSWIGSAAGGAGGKGAGAESSGHYAAAAGSAGSGKNGGCFGWTYGGTGSTGGALGNGAYITGNANVTWLTTGTRTGSVVS